MTVTQHSPSSKDGPPPPAVVLAGQLEVRERYSDAGRDAQQDDEGQEQDAVQRVLLPAPQRRENVVELHRGGAATKQRIRRLRRDTRATGNEWESGRTNE